MSRRLLALFLLPMALSACSSGGDSTNIQTSAASQSAAIALNLLTAGSGRGIDSERPGAVLSVYIAAYLAHGPGSYTAATKGAEIQAGLQEPAPATDEVYLVLQQLGAALQVNIPDLLNRSTTRRQTLDEYVKTLQEIVTESEKQVTLLEQKADVLDEQRDEENDVVKTISRDLNKALRAKDYSTAARKQEELQPAETKLSATEVQQDEIENILDIYGDLLELAAERLDAIAKNREVLIAGQKVVDVPGIDDLGVLQRNKRSKLGL